MIFTLSKTTIERGGREGPKEGQYFSAAFAAFAFQCSVSY